MIEIVYESRGELTGGSLSMERTVKGRPSGTRVVTANIMLTVFQGVSHSMTHTYSLNALRLTRFLSVHRLLVLSRRFTAHSSIEIKTGPKAHV